MKQSIKNIHLISAQLLVLFLPAWGFVTARELGYDFAEISVAVTAIGVYLTVGCWVVWGEAGTGPLLLKARSGCRSVLLEKQ